MDEKLKIGDVVEGIIGLHDNSTVFKIGKITAFGKYDNRAMQPTLSIESLYDNYKNGLPVGYWGKVRNFKLASKVYQILYG